LVQCAWAASRSKKNPEIKNKYQQLKKRRGGKKACIAIARRLLTAIFQMLLKDEAYTPFVAQAKDSTPKKRVLTAEQGLALLRKHGYIIEDEETKPTGAA